jgi:hypothetical protein
MSEPSSTAGGPSGHLDNLSVLFAQLVMQQANMALMLLGKVKNPQTGETVKDLEAARLFIDELEMLEVKTKGNLSREESGILKQTLMDLRLAFVDAVEAPANAPSNEGPQKAAPTEAKSSSPASEPSVAAAEEEHRKKFTKKY